MASQLDLSKNLSLFTVPGAFILCLIPHVWSTALSRGKYDAAQPRKMMTLIQNDTTLDKAVAQKIARAKGASENGFETLGFYAAAVLAANHAGVDARSLNLLTLGYLLSRVLYIICYVQLGANRRMVPLRSLTWTTGTILSMTLYIKAGLKVV